MEGVKKNQYWEESPGVVFSTLLSSPKGLSLKEAKKRLEKNGKNEIATHKSRPAIVIFFLQFSNPLILILLLASVISGFLGEVISTVIIIVTIIISGCISFIQEYRSEKTVELLRKRVALKTEVIRENKIVTISASELVVGDVVILSLGKVVPADLRLFESNGLAINESILTGESFPVEKIIEEHKVKDYLPQAMVNLAFMGTFVAQGSGRGVVIATGKKTEFGKTAKLLNNKSAPSQFQKGINELGYFLFKIIILFSLAIFLFLAVARGDWLVSLLFALSIAVGISPELLPMIITVNLSQAARILAKNKVIVKKLSAIENLGNADILCTDKTGTITEGEIILKDYFDFSGANNPEILKLGLLCNSLALKKNYFSNPLDEAVMKFRRVGENKTLTKGYRIVDCLPFDFQRRRMSVVIKKEERSIITKGAADEILKVCDHVLVNGKNYQLSGKRLKEIKNLIDQQEAQGFKIILLAKKEIIEKKYVVSDEQGLILMGYLVFFDPPKKTVIKSLMAFREMGVTVKLITGDTAESATFLAQTTGFANLEVCLGSQLDRMNDAELRMAVGDHDIFAKTTPEHKLKIVRALRDKGHGVAFLGDGVNDSPALREADAGISVNSATDIARESADIILLKKDLRILIQGIKEGRKNFGNTLKYIFCTISSNYGNMFSVIGAAIILPFIPMLPVQILMLNFISDLPMLAISSDNVDDEYLRKPKQWDIKKIRRFMNYFGLLSSLFDFITFGFLILVAKASMSMFQTGWFWQSFLSEVVLIFIVRTKKWFWQSLPSKILFIASILTLLLVLFILYTPIAQLFGFELMPLWINFSIIGITLVYFVVVEFGKKWFYNKYGI